MNYFGAKKIYKSEPIHHFHHQALALFPLLLCQIKTFYRHNFSVGYVESSLVTRFFINDLKHEDGQSLKK